jgi:hypothetical protein
MAENCKGHNNLTKNSDDNFRIFHFHAGKQFTDEAKEFKAKA